MTVTTDPRKTGVNPGTTTLAARVAFIGDSITAADADNANGIWGNGWPTYLLLALNGQATHAGNFAVGGTNSAHALNTQLPQVLAVTPRVTHCFVSTGTNDTSPSTETLPNVTAICAQLQAAGIVPIIRNMPPAGTAAISAPTVTATPSASGGTLATATYSYRVSAVNGVGETLAAAAVTAAVTGPTGSVTLTWPAVQGATGYKIYGRTGGSELFIAYNNNTGGQSRPSMSYTDTGSVTPSGALPVSNTTAVALSGTARTKITTGNAILNRLAQASGFPFYDAYSFYVDASTGMYLTGYTSDGTHPTQKAHKLIGVDMASKLSGVFAPYTPYLAGDNSDPTVIYTNPLFASNNGTVPTSWGAFGGSGAAESIVAGTNGKGSAFQVARTDTTARFANIGISSGWSVGDRLRVAGKITVTGADANGGQGSFQVKFINGSRSYLVNYPLNSDTPSTNTFVAEAVVPSGTTSVELDTAVAYGPVTLKIENITLQNLTTLGLA